MAAVTRLGLHGGPRGLYGDFTGKAAGAVQMSGTTGFAWTPSGALDVEATLAGSTGWDTAPTGALDVEATLAGSTGFTWTPTGNLVDTDAATTITPAGGGWMPLSDFYDRYKVEQKEREEERKRIKADIAVIEDDTDAQIAKLLHEQMEREAREQELTELEAYVAKSYADPQVLAVEYNEKVAKAYVRAAAQMNFSAMEALERELDRAIEEEEFLMIAMTVLH